MYEGASERRSAKASRLPSLVVVVVNWNGRRLLADCLGSVLADGYPALRVIMVDNASSDDSVPFVQERFPQVEIITAPENLRWAEGNNLVLRRLRAEGLGRGHLLLLNNDTVVVAGCLGRMVAALLAERQAWAATPRICYAAAPDRIWYDGGRVGRWTGWIRHAGIRRPVAGRSRQNHFVDYGTGCALMLNEEALRSVGEMDTGYYLYGEDTDYCLRIRALGGRILHVPEAVVLHKVSAALGSESPRKAYLRSRSHIQLLRRHWSLRTWPVLLPAQVGYHGALSLWHLWGGRASVALAVLRGAWDELRGAGAPDAP